MRTLSPPLWFCAVALPNPAYGLDLPKLTTLSANGEDSESFKYVYHITLESPPSLPLSVVDLPLLATAILPSTAFQNRVHVKINGSPIHLPLLHT